MQAHLYRAKLIVYSLFLVVGVTQIVIREHFPEVHPPWHWIGGLLIVVLLGIVFVPPLRHYFRGRQKPKSERQDAHS